MKILFTSAGRRVELVQAYKEAAVENGLDLEIIGGDVSASAPALCFCDKSVVLPPIKDSSYIPFLKEYCMTENVSALIPTIDTDLLLLAENKDSFGKTKVVISNLDKIRICRDKRLTAEYFRSLGLKSPMTVDNVTKYTETFPAFIKPMDGSASINAFKVETMEELNNMAQRVPNYIIQQYVSGTEYTVDIFGDFSGNPILITPRIRLSVRAGEVLKTKIDLDSKIIDEMKVLVADFKPCGAITVQLIRDNITGEDYYLEINPRYGGGAPLSIKAGANSADVMLKLLSGQQMSYMENAAEDGAVFCRFDQSVRVNS